MSMMKLPRVICTLTTLRRDMKKTTVVSDKATLLFISGSSTGTIMIGRNFSLRFHGNLNLTLQIGAPRGFRTSYGDAFWGPGSICRYPLVHVPADIKHLIA